MNVPDDRRYTEEHEWLLALDGNRVRLGITDYAQDSLGDIVYVDLPEVGRDVTKGETIAEVESTKSVAEIYAPVSGTVVTVNESLDEAPERINGDPYGEGWMVELEVAGSADSASLLEAAAYVELTES